MTQNTALKTGVFSQQATDWATGWLTKQGFTRQGIDGARSDELGENGRCLKPGEKNGKVETSEAFAVATGADTFGKFVAALQSSRINPFTKLDAGFDLSWLRLDGRSFEIDPAVKSAWVSKLGGPESDEGSLAQIAAGMRRKNFGYLFEKDASALADRFLRTTEFGLLPLKDQLTLLDGFVDSQTFADDKKEACRALMRRAVVNHVSRHTANDLVSLYAQLRGDALARGGDARKATELYDLAAKIAPANITAAAKRGDFESLKAAYDAGIRDDDLLVKLAEGYAARGDYAAAASIAMEKRGRADLSYKATSDEISWDVKLCTWALQNGDLLLADKVLRNKTAGGIQNIRDEERQKIMISLDDPALWTAKAEALWKDGDYEAAYACFGKAIEYAGSEVRVTSGGGLERAYLPQKDKAPIDAILARRNEMARDRGALPETLKSRYETLDVLARTSRGVDFAKADAELKLYEKAMGGLERLDKIDEKGGIKHANVEDAVSRAKMLLASGGLHGNDKRIEEGLALVEQLERYQGLEALKEKTFERALGLYYANTRYIFCWDLSDAKTAGIEGFEVPASDVEKLAVIQTIKRLETENPELAAFGKSLLGDLRNTSTRKGYRADGLGYTDLLLYNPANDGPLVDGYHERTWDKSVNERLDAIYGDEDRVEAFFAEVEKTRGDQSIKENKDYKKRIELDEGVRALPSYVSFIKAFEMASLAGGEGIDVTALDEARVYLMERGKFLKTHLESHREWADERLPSEQGAMAYQASLEQVGLLEQDIAWLEGLTFPAADDPERSAKMAVILHRLEATTIKLASHEQSHVKNLLEEEAGTVDRQSADAGNPLADIGPVLDEINGLPVFNSYGIEESLNDPALRKELIASLENGSAAYTAAAQKIDDVAFARAIDGRMAALKAEGKSVNRAAKFGYYWITVGGLLDFDGDMKPTDSTADIMPQWQKVKDLWASGDPAKRNEARKLYMALSNVSFNGELHSLAKWAKVTDTLLAVEAIVLAGMTAGAASEFAAPFVEAAFSEWGATQALTFVNALVFTGSMRVYDGLLHDGLGGAWDGVKSIGENPLGFAEEVALTFGMFKFMGLADSLFERTLGKYLGETGNMVGKFVAEGSAFQVWDFLQTNYMMIRHGQWDPLKAAGHAFNVTSLDSGFIHGFLFLIALKAGGTLSAPLARPMTEAAQKLAYKTLGIDGMERELQKGLEQNLKAIDLFVREGKGNLRDLLDRQEALLRKQKAYLEKLPEGIRNEGLMSLNGRMLENVGQFRAAYEASVLEKVKQGGAHNPYGVKVFKGRIFEYSAAKGVAFVSDLKKDPSVKAVEVGSNGLIVVDLIDPLGRKARLRLAPSGGPIPVHAMQKAASVEPVKPSKQTEAAGPQIPVLQPVNI